MLTWRGIAAVLLLLGIVADWLGMRLSRITMPRHSHSIAFHSDCEKLLLGNSSHAKEVLRAAADSERFERLVLSLVKLSRIDVARKRRLEHCNREAERAAAIPREEELLENERCSAALKSLEIVLYGMLNTLD